MSGKSRSHGAIQKLKEKFINGCVKKHYSLNMAKQLWDQIESFAGYAFCKAHSASFARISFIVAYLKSHFSAEFMASVLSNRGGFYAPFVYVEETRRMNLKILPPDVNKAEYDFIPVQNGIMIGLSFIKTLPYTTINTILKERKKHEFQDLYDFIQRCNITETEFMVLLKCGGLDWAGDNRKQLFFLAGHINRLKKTLNGSLLLNDKISDSAAPSRASETYQDSNPVGKEFSNLARIRGFKDLRNKNQSKFRYSNILGIPEMKDLTLKQKILFEIETLGFSFTANPLTLIHPHVKVVRSYEMKNYVNKYVNMIGVRIFSKRIPAKKKEGYMKFISFMDQYGTFETFLSLKNYNHLTALSQASYILQVYGRIKEYFEA